MKLCVPDYILSLKPYVAGKPLEELEREYGITNAIKLASNENPLGPSPKAMKAIRLAVEDLHRYPNGGSYHLHESISKRFDVKSENIVLGNGSDDIISMLARVLLQPGDEAVLPRPTFLFYEIMIRCSGAVPVEVPLSWQLYAEPELDVAAVLDQARTANTRALYLITPNNPDGQVYTQSRSMIAPCMWPSMICHLGESAIAEWVITMGMKDFSSSQNFGPFSNRPK